MGRHDHPDYIWKPQFLGYQCEACKGFWAALQVDEGVLPQPVYCLATEHCRGPVVVLINPEGPPASAIPVILEWFKPKNNIRFLRDPFLNQHLENDGLLSRPTPLAPDWVRGRIGYFGGLRTY